MPDANAISSDLSPGRALPSRSGEPADPKLWRASRQFEAVFMTQFVKAMRATEGGGGLIEKAAGREVFDEMFSEAIARNMVESGATGLARNIYLDLGGRFRQYEAMDAKFPRASLGTADAHAERSEDPNGSR